MLGSKSCILGGLESCTMRMLFERWGEIKKKEKSEWYIKHKFGMINFDFYILWPNLFLPLSCQIFFFFFGGKCNSNENICLEKTWVLNHVYSIIKSSNHFLNITYVSKWKCLPWPCCSILSTGHVRRMEMETEAPQQNVYFELLPYVRFIYF